MAYMCTKFEVSSMSKVLNGSHSYNNTHLGGDILS